MSAEMYDTFAIGCGAGGSVRVNPALYGYASDLRLGQYLGNGKEY